MKTVTNVSKSFFKMMTTRCSLNSVLITVYMFYLISFTDSCKYMLILNLLAASHFKHGGTGAVKDGESCGALIKHLRGTFHRSTGSLVAGGSVVIGLGHPPKTLSFTSRLHNDITMS